MPDLKFMTEALDMTRSRANMFRSICTPADKLTDDVNFTDAMVLLVCDFMVRSGWSVEQTVEAIRVFAPQITAYSDELMTALNGKPVKLPLFWVAVFDNRYVGVTHLEHGSSLWDTFESVKVAVPTIVPGFSYKMCLPIVYLRFNVLADTFGHAKLSRALLSGALFEGRIDGP